ncbi:MAG: hypothetical protein NC180_01955 [Muribaculaceae bacterium]|nr:hypothetical protein [Roseburia sp.]MCM1430706.1 hypothetical protein [Muribaculaceae bacterium]MCM1491973.1 hypothetical protein [Muribaculaceae bacterium]
MKDDFKMGLKLIKYGLSMKGNMAMCIIFFVVGLVLECIPPMRTTYMRNSGFEMGALFMLCAMMFPAQMIISMDVGSLAQTSAYKKKLQTSIPVMVSGAGSLFSLTIIVLIRLVSVGLGGGVWELQDIFVIGVMDFLLLVYFGFVYKFFVPSLVILYVVMIGYSFTRGLLEAVISDNGWQLTLSPAASIICAYVLLLAGLGIQYLIMRAVYKREFSRAAFGAAIRRMS